MATPRVSMIVYFEGGASFLYNLETEFGLILTSYKYTPPEAKTEYVSVPGRDGDLDFTEALYGSNGTVHVGNARLEMRFAFPPSAADTLLQVTGFHNHRVSVHIPEGFLRLVDLHGRVAVGDIESAVLSGTLTMTVNVESRSNAT